MTTVTPLMRAILQVLDTCEQGAHETQLVPKLCSTYEGLYHHDELMAALRALHSNGLTRQRMDHTSDDLLDRAIGLIVYSISAIGCDALWALQKADAMCPARTATYWTGH